MSQPFSLVSTGLKFEVEIEGNSPIKRFALTRTKAFQPAGIRVEGEGLADITISGVTIAKQVVTTTPISLSIVKLFSRTIDKQLAKILMKSGDTLEFNLKNRGSVSRRVTIYIDTE
jgi:hypothetical protein